MPNKKKKTREDAIELLKQKAANNGLKNQAQQGARTARLNTTTSKDNTDTTTSKTSKTSTTTKKSFQSSQRTSQSPSAIDRLFRTTANRTTGTRTLDTDKYGDGSARGDGRGVMTSATTSLRDKHGINLKDKREIQRFDSNRAKELSNNQFDNKTRNTVRRTTDTLKGAGKQFIGGHLSSIGTAAQFAEPTVRGIQKTDYREPTNNYSLRSRADAERRERESLINIGVKEGRDLRTFKGRDYSGQNENLQNFVNRADKLIESGSRDIGRAKEGLGKVGRLAVDIGANAAQMAGDMASNFAFPGLGIVSLMNRAGGSAAYEGRQEGMNVNQQMAYAAGTGLIEGLSEGIFNSVTAFRSAYGKGAFSLADRVGTRAAASKIVNRYLKTDIGKSLAVNLAKLGAQGFEEGIEELVADITEPALKYALTGSFDGYNPKDMAYDFLVGALMAGIPGSVDVGRNVQSDISFKAQHDGQEYAQSLIDRGLVQGRMFEQATGKKQGKTNAEVLANILQEQQARGREIQPSQARMLEEAISESETANAIGFEERSQRAEKQAAKEGRLTRSTGTRTEQTAYERGVQTVEQRNTERARTVMGTDANEESVRAVARVTTGTATSEDIDTILMDPMARSAVESITGEKLSGVNAEARDTLEGLTSMHEISNKDTIRKEVQTAHAEDIRAELTNMSKRGGDLFAKNYAEAVNVIGNGNTYEDVFTRLYADGTVKESNFEDAYERIVAPRDWQTREYFTREVAQRIFNEGRAAIVSNEAKATAQTMAEKASRMTAGLTFEGNAKGKISKRQADLLTKFAERANAHIRVVETMSKTLEDGTVLSANGAYRDGTIYIAADASNKLITVAKHELTHHVKKFSPGRYQELEDFVFQKWYDSDADAMEDEIRKKQLLYGDITVEEAREEIIADASEAFFTDEGAIQEVMSFSEKLGRAIHDGIKTLLDTLLDLRDADNLKDRGYGDFLDDIGILRDAERMWLEALEDSRERGRGNEKVEATEKSHAKFSLKDSDGNTLTEAQAEYFKDSKVRDKEGNLLKVYHGTANGGAFTVFDPKKLNNSKLTSHIGQGFYFTNSREGASEYTKNIDANGRLSPGTNPHLFGGYLKIENPIEVSQNSHNITYSQIKNIVADGDKEWFFNRGIAQELQNKEINGERYTKDQILKMSREDKIDLYAQYLARYGDQAALSNMVDAYSYDSQDLLLDAMKKYTGHDGVHWNVREGLDQFVAFDSNQFKLADNENPTESKDIRYSIKESGRTIREYSTDAYSGQVDMRMESYDGDNLAGYMQYSVYDDTPNIQFIHTEDGYKRQGVATEMLQRLQSQYPDKEIGWGMTTPDGTKLKEKATYEVKDKAVTKKKKRLQSMKNEIAKNESEMEKLWEKAEDRDFTEGERAQMEELGKRWDDLNAGIHKLERDLEGKKEVKHMVKLDDNAKYSLKDSTEETETEKAINESMTMEQCKQMIQRCYNIGDIREWSDGEYKNGDEWIRAMGSEEVGMVAENDYTIQQKYIDKIEGILNEDFSIYDVLDAYLTGTLRGKEKAKPKRLDISKGSEKTDSRFYAPKLIENAVEAYRIANQKATSKNKDDINKARAKVLLFAHNAGAEEILGITRAELNKKLRSWSNYSASARDISKRINSNIPVSNRWTGIENLSWISRATVSNEELSNLVKDIKGESSEYERSYIARTMLALDTHIDWRELSFEFKDRPDPNRTTVRGFYSDPARKIVISHNRPNTVAHEMGHALDARWGRDIGSSIGLGMYLTHYTNPTIQRITNPEVRQFAQNFALFMDEISDFCDIRSDYTGRNEEVFARFVDQFVRWTEKTATGRSAYSDFDYNDKFKQSHYVEFAKLLQEKASLDAKGLFNQAAESKDLKFSLKEPSYGYHAGDLGKSAGDSYYSQSFSRGTGHFGFGTYFVGDKAILKGTGLDDRPVETVDFDKYNLFRPTSYRRGIELHEALKVLDGYAKRYSDLSKLTDWDNWKERSYLTGGVLNDLDEYIWQLSERENPSKELKAKIDKYIEGMPEYYRNELENKVNKRYEEAQRRSTDEELVKEALGREFDRLYGDRGKSYLYDSKEAYIEGNLDNEIKYINEDKARSLEDWKYHEAESVIKDYTKELSEDIDNVRDIDFKLWMALGGSKEDIQNALKKTEEVIKAYPEITKGLDSAATVFMKQLGYEGVDVRGIEGLDNTRYGSVIYDLKGEDLARKKEIGTAKYQLKSPGSTDTIASQNTISKLEQKVADLKSEFKRTDLKTANQKDVRVQAGRLIKRHDSNMGVQKDLQDTFNKIFRLYKEKGTEAFDEVYEIAKDEAVNIVNSIGIIHDEGAEEYRAIKDYLRTTPITISEDMKKNITDFNDFRKRYFGKLKLTNGETSNIDNVYMELAEMFPEQFTEDYVNPADQLYHMVDVLDNYAPYYETLDGASEEMQDYVVEIASDIMETAYGLQTKKTFADRKYLEKEAAVKREREKALESRNKALSRQEQRYDKKIEALRAALWEANEKTAAEKMRGEMDVQRQKRKLEQYKETTRENAEKKRRIRQISNIHKRLTEKLMTPSDTKHLPDGYAQVVADILARFDFTTPGMEKWAERTGKTSRKMYTLHNLETKLRELAKKEGGEIEIDEDIIPIVTELADTLRDSGTRLSDLSSEELTNIKRLFAAFEKQINSYNKAFDENNKQNIAESANRVFTEIDEAKRGKWKLGVMGRLMTNNFNPSDFFTLVGGEIEGLYDATRKGFDRYVDHLSDAKDFIQGEVKARTADKWANHTDTYKTSSGEEITLTDTQLMGLYCLSRREQAQNHIYFGGIKSAPVRVKGRVAPKTLEEKRVIPTQEDLVGWFRKLSPEQIKVAESIQEYLSTESSEWGNETSMKLYGYKKFNEELYYPIQSSKDYRASNFDMRGDDPTLKNMGMTKALVKEASNVIVVDDIFMVFSKHIAQMAAYNAYVPAITDFQRVWNYTEGNDQDTVKARFADTYGRNTANYIEDFFKNLNGVYKQNFDAGLFDKGLGLFKKAAVGGNLRVLVQQPTAIARAGLIINPAYLAASVPATAAQAKKTYKEMMEHCPIAKWKSWGFYSSDITSASRDLRNIMIGKDALTDKVFMDMYGVADNATWTIIFNACKMQVEAKNKGPKKGSDEYWEKVNDLASEVFDRTQVVDSPFHRSAIMKSQDKGIKMVTAFMAEPTKTINMINTEMTLAGRELMAGHPAKAIAIATKITAVVAANAALLAAAQSLVDAMRHIGGDDDKDKGKYKDRYKAYWMENFRDNLNLAKMVPYIKDVYSLYEGYEVARMDMNGVKKVIDAGKYLQKYYADPASSKYTEKEEWSNLFYACTYAMGIPISNAKRDLEAIYMTAREAMGYNDMVFNQAKKKYQVNDKTQNMFAKMYLGAKGEGDEKLARDIKSYMIENGITEDYIEGKEKDFKKTNKTEGQQESFEKSIKTLEGSAIWKGAEEDDKNRYSGYLEKISVGIVDSNTESLEKYATDGLTVEQVVLFKLALRKVDKPNKNGNLDTFDKAEKEEALKLLMKNYKFTEKQKEILLTIKS